jgi:hypothetical protein
METMDDALLVQVPRALCPIFSQWAAPCDPAPLAHGGADAGADAGVIYALLAAASFDALLARQALARVHRDALANMVFGQFAELRDEGAQVLAWIAQVVAADPLLRERLRS